MGTSEMKNIDVFACSVTVSRKSMTNGFDSTLCENDQNMKKYFLD
jgi:hypothetical protein